MHRTGTKHIVCHMQKSVVQWSVISKFTCSTCIWTWFFVHSWRFLIEHFKSKDSHTSSFSVSCDYIWHSGFYKGCNYKGCDWKWRWPVWFSSLIYLKPMMQIVLGVMGSIEPRDEWQKYTGMVKNTMYICYHIKGVYAIFAMIWILADWKSC